MKFASAAVALALMVSAAVANGRVSADAPASGQTAAVGAQPSPEALELAKAVELRRLWTLTRITPAEMKELIKRRLLSMGSLPRGRGCDPTTSECQAGADAVASKHATEFARNQNESIDQAYAQMLQAKMSPAQIRAPLNFIRTDAGQAFAMALRSVDSEDDQMAVVTLLANQKVPSVPYEEFYDVTKGLPRAKLPFAPPPPAWPPAATRPLRSH